MKKLFKSKFFQHIAGKLIAWYLKLVYLTSRIKCYPDNPYANAAELKPFILAMWHGQHFMVSFMRAAGHDIRALVSRSADGTINAVALETLGVKTIRGSGGRNRHKTISKGGVSGLLAMQKALASDISIAMTVNIPHGEARQAGAGVAMLAKISGCPVIPVAFATRHRVDFDTWDKASLNLPFGAAGFVVGKPVFVDNDADDLAIEEGRKQITAELESVTGRAYELAGGQYRT